VLSNRREITPPPTPEEPDDLLTGKCPTCKSVIEVRRKQARPPDSRQRISRFVANSFMSQNELWSIECPVCVHKGMKVTDGVSGDVSQTEGGPRVFLLRKG
jgi:Zn finger protein HypA/HybF involved in hydrogenase expression